MKYKVKDIALGTTISVRKSQGMVEVVLDEKTPQSQLEELYIYCPNLIEKVEQKTK